ncbi:AraC family transcriptional regulator, regulatory protein of adaptative response / methylated-DNA-[protein]-cysteine methyltransferase [Fictibacillus solisalsi]|uniref:Methylated-DNA--protein-cysteine methyltransferase n=1 Tax=Fictibacillus solisalsi TaxID=459525 RepID=A0A1G9XWT5_9BACL|nr:methylated-DNA--[protein]-cysteine S-methyltransferase [Fictibacillus solisalsi]SDN01247.1 AraC family transcriptional regulator, regulatory protein of adaptative response / methylated-DNA-[protein]-cysteine methyltransferase [Fictibacillus solisalsi]
MDMKLQDRYDFIEPGDPKHDALYEKMLKKEERAGYYIGVTTTGIACRFGCSATPPQKENTVFSRRLFDLIAFGFRECKVCRPLTHGTEQDDVETFAELIQKADHPEKYLKQVSPGDTSYRAARRWFEQKHDGDLQKYMYVKRVNHLLKSENNQDPEHSNIITYQRYWTPIGVLIACFYEGECCLLEFMDRRALETELLFLKKKLNANLKKRAGAVSRQLGKEMEEYFAGDRQTFTVPIASIGTDFQLKVWDALKEIPYGTTRSYKGQAEHLGRPTAVRAVANANGKNRICILIPCHRVIGDNGDLRGYAGGLDRKQFLLELEESKGLQ